jgi:D-xylulose reductase
MFITDVQQPKLDMAAKLGPITPVNVGKESLADVVAKATDGWGADIVFEASGNPQAAAGVSHCARAGGSFSSVCPVNP